MNLVIIATAGLITFIFLLSGEDSRRRLLYFGLASIVVGHRSIYIGQISYLVPFEIIIFLLFGIMFASEILKKEHHDITIPKLLIFVTIWSLIRALISLIDGSFWDSIFAWTAPLALGLPTFWVVRRLITRVDHLATTLNILLGVSVFISILGLVEYFYPSVGRILPGIFSGREIFTADGFVRASFSFWGYPIAAVIVTWGMLVAYHEIINPNRYYHLWIYVGLFLVCGAAVYFSGQRSSWLGLFLAIFLLSISGRLKGWFGIILMFIAASFLPAVFWNRFNTVTVYVEYGRVSDSSTAERLARWSWGWDAMIHNPVGGVGYGHWLVHNAFLEIGSTIGVIAAIAFLLFIIQLIWRIASVALRGSTPEAQRYGWLFLAIAVTWVMQINVETIFQTPAIAVAFWPYMALAWYLPDLYKELKDNDKPQSYRRAFK